MKTYYVFATDIALACLQKCYILGLVGMTQIVKKINKTCNFLGCDKCSGENYCKERR